MIKILGAGETRPARRTKKSSAAAAPFAPQTSAAQGAGKAGGAGAAAAPAMLSALIALQTRDGGNAKTFAAAQRTLDLLDNIRLSILDGQTTIDDLTILAHAVEQRAHAGATPELMGVYDEISLRARVELAKRGR